MTAPAAANTAPRPSCIDSGVLLKSARRIQGPPCDFAEASAAVISSRFRVVRPSEFQRYALITRMPPGKAAWTHNAVSLPGEASGLMSARST